MKSNNLGTDIFYTAGMIQGSLNLSARLVSKLRLNWQKKSTDIFRTEKIDQAIFLARPQHFLYFLPLPHGQGEFLPIEG